MDILQIVTSTIVSTGILAALIHHHYDKKLRAHELKLQKYLELGEEIAKLVGNMPNYDRLLPLLNETLLFASDDVVAEILKFNQVFTERRKQGTGNTFRLSATDVTPLIVAIRSELDLKSNSIKKEGLTFFQKP